MCIVDRYVLGNFFRVFLICTLSISGMYLVVDFVNNLTEFVDYAGHRENLWIVLGTYYGARLPWFFDLTSRIMALVSAAFVLTWLERQNEMAALMAAGIPRWRLIQPLIGATLAISLLAAANREFGIPAVRSQLCLRSRDWMSDGGRDLQPAFDDQLDLWIGGQKTYSRDRRIAAPTFRFSSGLPGFGRRIVAQQALYKDASPDRPAGYLLQQVSVPVNLAEIPSVEVAGTRAVYSPRDTRWLEPGECFVASRINFEHLESGLDWYRLSSTVELLEALRSQSVEFTSDVRILVHSRLIQPLLDMTLLFVALPIVVSHQRRNVFASVGLCVLVVTGFMIVVLLFQAMGTNYLIRPALAAWAPLMIFVPAAVALSGALRR